jgi:16S rRNA G1207 methylase RsmC
MLLPSEGQALDLGCGYGAVGIVAAVLNPRLRVVMVDVNDRAVRLARMNVEFNKVANAEVRHGSLYEPVKDLVFDCILSNPPVSAGLKTVTDMVTQAPVHLVDEGKLEMVFRSKVAGSRLLSVFEEAFGNVCVLARGSGFRVLMAKKR